ncbi:MAG: CDF family Co(II)/Ni(II) efflux transporter DmeF [Desulfobulbales bacterium]
MHIHSLEKWQHNHDFAFIHEKGETRTKQVFAITIITMIVEIIAGTLFGSMALLADGWHMGTHAAAFAITIFAYQYSRRHATNRDFTFGTGKVSILGGYSSAIALAVIALFIGVESIERLIQPLEIHFDQAIAVAIIGLLVNLFCAFLLHGHHTHIHNEGHKHSHHHDHNLRGAYLHVLADALTSVLAIIALLFGKFFGWYWLDPLIGIVGAMVITRWSYGLLKDTSAILLDKNVDQENIKEIQKKIESDADNRVTDIHVWQVGPIDYAAIISLVTHYPKPIEHYKGLISDFKELSHVTIETYECLEEPCLVSDS